VKTKLFAILGVLYLSAMLAQPILGQDEETEDDLPDGLVEYTVTADVANLRSEPNTNSEVVGSASNGDTLLIYSDNSEHDGWLRIFDEEIESAYIADFLVERAPLRYYPLEQEPIAVLEGTGKQITDIIDLPEGAYRFDAEIDDNFFILSAIVIEGDCRDTTIFNEGGRENPRLNISTLIVSSGCSFIFESDNVDNEWIIEIRDVLDEEYLFDSILEIEDGTVLSGRGLQATMPTLIEEGIWTISAEVDDNYFILRSEPSGDCDSGTVFNEGVRDANSLSVSTVFRANETCIVFWLTSNVDTDWEITFEKLR